MAMTHLQSDYCEICKTIIPDSLLDKIEIILDSNGEFEIFCPLHKGYWKLNEEQKNGLFHNILQNILTNKIPF
jgi:hypothetical protein